MNNFPTPITLRFRPEMYGDIYFARGYLLGKESTLSIEDVIGSEQTAFEVKIKNVREAKQFIMALHLTVDGHRMYQTLDTAEEYTGEWLGNENTERVIDAFDGAGLYGEALHLHRYLYKG